MKNQTVLDGAEAAIGDYEKEIHRADAPEPDREDLYKLATLKTNLALATALTNIASGNRDIGLI